MKKTKAKKFSFRKGIHRIGDILDDIWYEISSFIYMIGIAPILLFIALVVFWFVKNWELVA